MKLRKLMAASMAAAVAACAVSVTSFAASYDVVDEVTITSADNVAYFPIELFDGIVVDTMTITGVVDASEGWVGGGGAIGFDSTDGWVQVDYSAETADVETGVFTAELDFGGKTADLAKEGALIMIGWWWGSGDGSMTVTDVTVNGESMMPAADEGDGETAPEAIEINASNSPYVIMEGEAAIDMTKLTANIDLITDNANVNWNAWCNSTIAVTVNDVTEYFVFAGTQVSWDVTLNADTEDEVVIAPADFAAMADEGSIAVEMPVDISAGDDVTVEIIAQCWLDDTTGESAFAFTSLEIEEGEAEGGDVEIDVWESYDLDAATAANEAFVFGTDTNIDLYALVGDSWADLAKIDATFVWTPGLDGWCGGAGLGNGAVLEDGTNWISGPEYGAANANSAVEPDGTATQTIIDITGTPLADIVAVAEDGTVSYAQLQIQNWWNGVEAGAQLAALTAYDADGNVIGEIVYDGVEAPDASQDTDAPTDDKQSPDTGVEGIAAIAGVVALAGAAVVISRKRK